MIAGLWRRRVVGEDTHPSRECTECLVETQKVYFFLYSQQEERVMTYLSVLTGAVGIQYFIRRSVCAHQAVQLLISSLLLLSTAHTLTPLHSPGKFPYAPTAWSECRRLALEIRELSSAILSGRPQLEVHPSVTSGVLAVGWGERVEGAYVVAAVNYLKKPV